MHNSFARKPLPERFCNLERLLAAMEARGLDGLVLSSPLNVFYLCGFNGIAHKADEPRPYAACSRATRPTIRSWRSPTTTSRPSSPSRAGCATSARSAR
jgi:Xaa-Pro aminopeptidase